MASTVEEAVRHGEIRTPIGTYALSAEDSAGILADAVADPTVAGEVFNTFDRWVDYGDWAPLLSELLGREIRVAAPALEPRSPIRGERIHARYDRFDTDACVERVLRGLVAELPEGLV